MISLTLMSLVTSVKDYVEITHKFIELEPLKYYSELGALFTYLIVSIGNLFKDFFSFSLFKNIWSIPVIIPDIASAMISEISVLDGYFHNAFTFLDSNVSNVENVSSNTSIVILEKLFIGLINSFFLFLPTSTSHLITLRRFVMQGLEAGYISGLGTLAGNFLWLSSVILGCRFFVIPWLSFDIFRYLFGFILLVKYIWDSSKERRMPLENLSKWKIFLLNFLLALTEQTCIYPFISNLSFGPEASILEGFAADNYTQFLLVHGAYLAGILLGSFSLLQFACWFWENPAFSIYIWITTKAANSSSTSSTFGGKGGNYYKVLNFTLLYGTMLCAIASIPYYGLDYTITNPIGLVPQDRIIDQKKSQFDTEKLITETAFLGVNPTDKNTRVRDGVHARRERWKQRLIKYQAYDASIYDQGVYDFLTIEDLNYGFDRFWLRRKMRNHQIRFRLFPGPWMRSLKKQLNKPANLNNKEDLSSKAATGPRVEFFRILFEQFYHPNFHDRSNAFLQKAKTNKNQPAASFSSPYKQPAVPEGGSGQSVFEKKLNSPNPVLASISSIHLFNAKSKQVKPGLIYEHSALRKFVRHFNTRTNLKILSKGGTDQVTSLPPPSFFVSPQSCSVLCPDKKDVIMDNASYMGGSSITLKNQAGLGNVYSKRWKSLFSKIQPYTKTSNYKSYLLFRNLSKQILLPEKSQSLKLTNINQKLAPSDLKVLTALNSNHSQTLLRPLSFYLQKEQAFKRKLRYYGSTTMRKLTVGNQAPYLKTLMKRGFYYYKPSLRFKKTLYVASMRRGFRKKSRKQKNIIFNAATQYQAAFPLWGTNPASLLSGVGTGKEASTYINTELSTNKASYSILNKRASRYRHQIYKDVLQHWYYTPFNRLALKFDIDAFINRQPKTHFLTKNEERLLHIKRFLLSEHYDTLRWYTYMQHYRTMKTNIGGTKSFASRVYNQQFQGTFKKIRHLFAITPSQENFSILKFDQPLYNDNKLANNNLIYYHEELLINSTDNHLNKDEKQLVQQVNSEKVDSLESSTRPTGDLLDQSNYLIGKQLLTSNYYLPNIGKEKVGGVTNVVIPFGTVNTSYLQSLPRAYADSYRGKVKGNQNDIESKVRNTTTLDMNKETSELIYNELLVKLLKECKRQIYDQTFLKNYISHRIEKREQRNQEHTKELNKRLEKLKTWLIFEKNQKKEQKLNTSKQTLTNGMQKAINDSIFSTKKINPFYSNKPLLKFEAANLKYKPINLSYSLKTEEYIKTKLNVLKALAFTGEKVSPAHTLGERGKKYEGAYPLGVSAYSLKNKKNLLSVCKKMINNQIKILKVRTDKNLDWWRKKQRVITKRKNARKRDRFKKQMAGVNANIEKLLKKAKVEKSNLYKTLYGNYEISDYLLDSTKNNMPLVDSAFLRKKQDTGVERPSFSETKKSTLWEQFFIKKFRKKLSSKGRRYRSLSYGRYLTATRKPKTIGADISLNIDSSPNANQVILEGLSKIDGISSTNGFFLNKTDKQERLNLENLIAEGKVAASNIKDPNLIKQSLSVEDFKTTLKKGPINKRSRHTIVLKINTENVAFKVVVNLE